MVRRGSTVRVRQRALQKRRTPALLRSDQLAPRRLCGGYGAVYGAFALRTSDVAESVSETAECLAQSGDVLASRRRLNGSPFKVEPHGHSSIAPPICRRCWRNVYEE